LSKTEEIEINWYKMKSMNKEKDENLIRKDEKDKDLETKEERKELEKRIDEELDQSFPASDPPSYSQPGNDDIKHYE
jgi:hypothetical protein